MALLHSAPAPSFPIYVFPPTSHFLSPFHFPVHSPKCFPSLLSLPASSPRSFVVNAQPTLIDELALSRQFHISRGYPMPFGATLRDGGVNFSIYSANATSATLCLITLSDLHHNRVTEHIPLDPLINKTGDVWHVLLKGDFKDMLYGYKLDGKFSPEEGHYYDSSRILLDPYAKVSGPALFF